MLNKSLSFELSNESIDGEHLLKWIWDMASFKSFYCLFKWNENENET
jgi:hypothetical protein